MVQELLRTERTLKFLVLLRSFSLPLRMDYILIADSRNLDCYSLPRHSTKPSPLIAQKCKFRLTCSCLALHTRTWPLLVKFFSPPYHSVLTLSAFLSLSTTLYLGSDLLLS